MPCHDPRDAVGEKVMEAHHHRVEKLIDKWMKNVKIPKVWREQYAEEKKRYRDELRKVEDGWEP